MTSRQRLGLAAVALITLTSIGIGYNLLAGSSTDPGDFSAPVTQQPKAADALPIKQVVLFNSGVGYFQREGDIDGNARVELTFPMSDINDLLKSLVLQDAKGRVGVVQYDSSDPIEKTLRSFALDLTTNPTFGQILNQARGEKIEVTRVEKKDGPTTKIAGTIIGMEGQNRVVGMMVGAETEFLNLNTATGITAIPMEHVISVRFQNANLEREFQRALMVLARSHDTQKKTVSVGFTGDGKRQVKVGYVVERPIWKTTYRLRLDPNGKVFLQGWALVENTSDDDWNDVRMVLVSGKPISFKMNLYDPIYVPRPIVEPELFASLRPPVYAGAMGPDGLPGKGPAPGQGAVGGMPGMMMGGGLMNGMMMGGMMNGMNGIGQGQGLNQFQQQTLANLSRADQEKALLEQNKLTYDELQRRRAEQLEKIKEAKEQGKVIAGMDFKEGIKSAASGDEVGDYYQYKIDQKITLPRQKSAMLPIIDQTIDGQKVSIFNAKVHGKYPLLGVKLKNTSGQPLTQGPITVYDGGVFGGDTRILDVQPGESRLLSYAVDQATEVKSEVKERPGPDLNLKLGFDTLSAKYSMRRTRTYTIKNRSIHDREVLIEHPIQNEWTLVDGQKPVEKSRDHYRFQISVPAGKTATFDVAEDNPRVEDFTNRTNFAVANGIHLKTETEVDFVKVTGVKIAKGVLTASMKQRQTKTYFFQNLSDVDRTFTVDHIIRSGWVRLDEKEPQKGPEVYRFKLAVAQSKTAQKTVREESSYDSADQAVKGLSEAVLRTHLTNPAVSIEVKAAINKVLASQAKVVETQKQIADLDKHLLVLTTDHARVRENLKIVPMTSEHYKGFLEKFVAQDKQIESLQGDMRKLNATLQARMREHEEMLMKLDAE